MCFGLVKLPMRHNTLITYKKKKSIEALVCVCVCVCCTKTINSGVHLYCLIMPNILVHFYIKYFCSILSDIAGCYRKLFQNILRDLAICHMPNNKV